MPDSVGVSNLEGTHMIDTPPSANPMPVPPVAAAQNPATPFPPADPRPVFEPPSVMDPVSNLDLLPVDDAFALEMRAESIEQLVGGDALRRGESERIEAGRSQTNADLVAGRDRVRVHGTLHEHTGHGLAEQATHLHTTFDGVLGVHADGEDTVLLAGHMSELWDGGAAIVAAMTDDTVAGGGIRVAGRRNDRLRPGGLGRRRASVLAARVDCHPVLVRAQCVQGGESASVGPCRDARLVRRAGVGGARRPLPAQRHRLLALRGRRGHGRRGLARD